MRVVPAEVHRDLVAGDAEHPGDEGQLVVCAHRREELLHVGALLHELLLVPRTETRTRFHAAQGLALQAAILVITGVFGFVTLISGSSVGGRLFGAASTIFLIVSMIRAFKGRPHHIAALDELTKWLDEKIKPRK